MKTQIKLKVTVPVQRDKIVAVVAHFIYTNYENQYKQWDVLAFAKDAFPKQQTITDAIKELYEDGDDTDGWWLRDSELEVWTAAEQLVDLRFPSMKGAG